MSKHSILEGIRIIEWAGWIAGPAGSSALGDLGAEVIKIEQPGVGDPARGVMQMEGEKTKYPEEMGEIIYEIVNRNKKSIVLDLTKPEGLQVLYKLVSVSDIFLQNWRKGIAEKHHADYKSLREHNEKLIYLNISCYGPEGPDSFRRGQDYVALARSGMLSAMRDDNNQPIHPAAGMADQMASIITTNSILGALLARERFGIGQEMDVSILGSTICLQQFPISATLLLGKDLPKRSRAHSHNPLQNHYQCKDGKWLVLGILASDRVWPDVCEAMGKKELEKDPRFSNWKGRSENHEALIGILDDVFSSKTRDEWMAILSRNPRIMCAPVNDVMDLAKDPQVLENDYIVEYDHPAWNRRVKAVGFPTRFSETPAAIQSAAPEYGQHTEEVLLEVGGYNWEEIATLKEKGAIG